MPLFLALIIVPPVYFVYHYRKTIQEKVEEIEHHYSKVRVHRVRDEIAPNRAHNIDCLELNPKFIKRFEGKFQMMSLGSYLSTLRLPRPPPRDNENNDDDNQNNHAKEISKFVRKELEMTLGKLLLNSFGSYGAALLPLSGADSIDSYLNGIASKMGAWASKQILSNNSISTIRTDDNGIDEDGDNDIAIFPFTMVELVSILNINSTVAGGGNMTKTPLEFLEIGEIDMFEHNFDGLISNPFVLEEDFEKTIKRMEHRIRDTDESYDPFDKSIPPPVPINERVLPDLYLGSGDTCYSHTKRETLANRLTAVLLTKLSYNYYKLSKNEKDLFEVDYKGETCQHPDEFLQALINHGHSVDVCPRTQITNFGMTLCVKEKDGSWTNIPTAIMLKTGFERYSDNRPVTFACPHGGIDFYITGPLIGTTNTCAMQFYIAFQGLCAFHSDQDVILPYKKKVSLSKPYSNQKAVQAARLAGLMSVAFSTISSEMELPFGGYGTMGMCNDICGFIDFAINSQTMSYPLSSTGRYLSHFIRVVMELSGTLKDKVGMEYAVDDIQKLIHSIANIKSDLHISPSTAKDSIQRYKACYPEIFFQETSDSLQVLNEIAEMYESLSVWSRVSRYL